MVTLVWDFDDTLAYREGRWTRSLCNVLKLNGYEHILEEDIRPHLQKDFPWHKHRLAHVEYFNGCTWWGYVNEVLLKALLANGIVESKAMELVHQFKEEYLDVRKWCVFEDTIRNLDESMNRGYANIILSNHVPELETLVKGLNMDKYFVKIITSGEVGYDKPNTMIYKELYKYVEYKSKLYMIGDSYSADVQGALNSGIDAILVRQDNKYNYEKYCANLDGIWKYIVE